MKQLHDYEHLLHVHSTRKFHRSNSPLKFIGNHWYTSILISLLVVWSKCQQASILAAEFADVDYFTACHFDKLPDDWDLHGTFVEMIPFVRLFIGGSH